MIYVKNYSYRCLKTGITLVVGQYLGKTKTKKWGVPIIDGRPVLGINGFKTRKAAIAAALKKA